MVFQCSIRVCDWSSDCGRGRPCGASWRSAHVFLPTSALGRCDWRPVFRPRNLTPSGTLGHAVLADTGHHAGGYLQDKVLEMSLVSCGKTTGFRPVTASAYSCAGFRRVTAALCFVKCNQYPSLACGKDYESISQLSSKGLQTKVAQ